MKVTFVVSSFYPRIGGVETHALAVAKQLVKEGHEISVITEGRGEEASKDKITGITVRYLNFGKNGFFKKFRIWRIMLKNKNLFQNADIIHCHDVFIWCLPLRILYPHIRFFTTFHGYETRVPPEKSAILIRKISEKLSSGNICVGSYIKKWYGTAPTYITYGGVDEKK